MGVVYKARDHGRGRVVALKSSSPKGRPTRGGHRFRREAQAAARLSHPNIVTVYTATTTAMFTSWHGVRPRRHVCNGSSSQIRPVPVGRACEFVRQTALGLQHASEQGLVHRDIKPPPHGRRTGPRGRRRPPIVKISSTWAWPGSTNCRDFHEESLTTLTRDGAVIRHARLYRA